MFPLQFPYTASVYPSVFLFQILILSIPCNHFASQLAPGGVNNFSRDSPHCRNIFFSLLPPILFKEFFSHSLSTRRKDFKKGLSWAGSCLTSRKSSLAIPFRDLSLSRDIVVSIQRGGEFCPFFFLIVLNFFFGSEATAWFIKGPPLPFPQR